jgi:hypothetical protein
MPDNTTLSPDDAFNVLVAQVHAPVFFEKLARDYGINPTTQEEARDFLSMAAQLRNANTQQEVKAAGAKSNFITEAKQDLNNVLVNQGFQPVSDTDKTIKQAAMAAVSNPLIKQAALVFNQYMNEQYDKASGG